MPLIAVPSISLIGVPDMCIDRFDRVMLVRLTLSVVALLSAISSVGEAMAFGWTRPEQRILLGCTFGTGFILFLDFFVFIVLLSRVNENSRWISAGALFYVGFTPNFLRATAKRIKEVKREAGIFRQPRFSEHKHIYNNLLRFGCWAELAFLLELEKEADEENTSMAVSERRLRRVLRQETKFERSQARQQRFREVVQRAFGTPVQNSCAALDDLRDRAMGVSREFRADIFSLLDSLDPQDPSPRRFKEGLRKARGMIEVAPKYTAPREVELRRVVAPILSEEIQEEKCDVGEAEIALPVEFKWANDRGILSYSRTFLDRLDGVLPTQRRAITRRIIRLAVYGPRYSSLKTKTITTKGRVPYTPVPCFVSRAAKNIRFTWTKKKGHIEVHYFFFKEEKEIPYNK